MFTTTVDMTERFGWLSVNAVAFFCVEQSKCPDDPEVLGEVKSEIRGIPSWDCTPPTRSAAGELTKMAQQAERQRPHRQECYRRYSIENRIQDLTGVR
jgi:hypothetical protein